MAQYWRKRRWRQDDWRRSYWRRNHWRGRNRNWYRSPASFRRYRKPSLWGMLKDFLIRLVAFTILCALGLAWVRFHFLNGCFPSSF